MIPRLSKDENELNKCDQYVVGIILFPHVQVEKTRGGLWTLRYIDPVGYRQGGAIHVRAYMSSGI